MGLIDAIGKDTEMTLRVPEFIKFVTDAASCMAERRVLLNALRNDIPYDHALIMAGYDVPNKGEEESKDEGGEF